MKEAKLAYLRLEKQEFAFEHCFETLRDVPKFANILEDEKQKTEKGKALDTDNGDEKKNDRPVGRKRAKLDGQKSNEEVDFDQILVKKMKKDEAVEKELMNTVKALAEMGRKTHEREIMGVDPSTIQDAARHRYYELEQQEIVERMEERRKASKKVEETVVLSDDENEVNE
jgi:hypothetical protein